MSRLLGVLIVAVLCAGCTSPRPVYDPFMGRTTVPPPGTAVAPAAPPYYNAAPAGITAPPLVSPPPTAGSSALPQRTIGPTNFAPSPAGGGGLSSFTPNVSPAQQSTPGILPASATSPLTPATAPSQPTTVRPTYGLPGGRSYPQATVNPANNAAPTPAQPTSASAPAANRPTSAVQPASFTSDTDNKSATPVVFASPADKAPIRIVEPPAGAATSTASATTAPSTQRGAAATSASAATLTQSLSNNRVTELSDLPSKAVSTSAAATQRPAPSSTTTADSASFGYDPQYRWLKGKLEYSQSTHSWRLRYIPPDGNTDNYGGSVMLPDSAKVAGLQAGDTVYAEGAMGAPGGSQNSFAPQYALARIQKI